MVIAGIFFHYSFPSAGTLAGCGSLPSRVIQTFIYGSGPLIRLPALDCSFQLNLTQGVVLKETLRNLLNSTHIFPTSIV